MDFMDFFWIFVVLAAIQPMLKQKMLETTRQRHIAKIQRKHNSRVIAIVHRQETMSLLGFPLFRFLNMEDSEQVLRALEVTDEERPIDIVLHTPGGLVIAATQIARAIVNRKGKVRVIIPHYAMSGGTLIALAADEVVMSPFAVMGPIDPQMNQYPAPSLVKLKSIKAVNEIDDESLIMADLAEKSIRQMRDELKTLLSYNHHPEKAQFLANLFTEGKWTHDYPINAKLAQELGLPVSTDMPKEFIKLMSMYPQPVRKNASVEYLPLQQSL